MQSWPAALPQRVFSSFTVTGRGGLNSDEEDLNPERTRTYPEHETTFKVVYDGGATCHVSNVSRNDLKRRLRTIHGALAFRHGL